ncbi:MAG: sensor domain-containing diguanylate cyclase, partial [Butyrivibrio sp.]
EINYTKNTLIVRIIIMILLILTVFIIAAMLIAKTIVRPLRELNVAAKEIAAGNLDVSLACRSKDEVGTLSESLKETAGQLKVRIDYINNLAYMDKLTEIKNNTAYLYEVSSVNERMNGQKISFAIFVIDVNGLKTVNDTRGHDYGNKLIIAVAKAAVGVFGEDKTYRIGGDEFAVILEDADNNICDRLEAEFQESLKSNPEGMQVSAAIGYAIYDKTTDSTFENVFKRADSNMYNNKLAMKAGRLN